MREIKVSKKAHKLTHILDDRSVKSSGTRLDNSTTKFKISIQHDLDVNFAFDNIHKNNGYKEFHNFICKTVGKNLTISQVNNLYLRTRGKGRTVQIGDAEFLEVHYGKDRSAFRVFGYYHSGDFILTRIDTKHETHK